MIELTQEQRAFIIWSIAHCKEPEHIVYSFNERWKAKPPCTIGDVGACDPKRLTGDWLAYFNEERETFLAAPTTDKRIRMALLNRVIMDLESRGMYRTDPKGFLQAVELMAKEDAGFFAPKALPGAKASGRIEFSFETDPVAPVPPPY
jgi:hypothetical protein